MKKSFKATCLQGYQVPQDDKDINYIIINGWYFQCLDIETRGWSSQVD